MRYRSMPAMLAMAGAILVAGRAQAAVEVLGEGPAKLCFNAANAIHTTAHDLTTCDDALMGALTRRDRAATYINRGVVLLNLMRYEAARADFDRGVATMPTLGEGYLNRGAALIAMKEFALALADIEKGMTLGVSRPAVGYYDRAIANEALGNLGAAYEDYKQALALEPGFDRAAKQLMRFRIVNKPGA